MGSTWGQMRYMRGGDAVRGRADDNVAVVGSVMTHEGWVAVAITQYFECLHCLLHTSLTKFLNFSKYLRAR